MLNLLAPIASALALVAALGGTLVLLPKLNALSEAVQALPEPYFGPAPATLKQLQRIGKECPVALLPGSPELLTVDQASTLLLSCTGKQAKSRQAAFVVMFERQRQAAQSQPSQPPAQASAPQ